MLRKKCSICHQVLETFSSILYIILDLFYVFICISFIQYLSQYYLYEFAVHYKRVKTGMPNTKGSPKG